MHLFASALLVAAVAASPLQHPAASNPKHNVKPTVAFERACYTGTAPTAACNRQAIKNINRARGEESLPAISLPGDFAKLSVDAQIVAVSNAERTARGLKALTETAANDSIAQTGADNDTDPVEPPGFPASWGGNWAGVADPLAADFLWMYDDGPGGPNGDCQQAGDPGCWGHRDNILRASWKTTGAGAGAGSNGASLAQLFVAKTS
jgi:uncharacterized protein YkwD